MERKVTLNAPGVGPDVAVDGHGVTRQDWAISAMVKFRESYMRWALSISAGVILGLRPPLRPRALAAASPA